MSYARSPYLAFLRRHLSSSSDVGRPVLFLGMNPGPWGMMQTGVPFGEVASVISFVGLDPTELHVGSPGALD